MRISRKRVIEICNCLSNDKLKYELIVHQNLGNRKDYYYTYSIAIYGKINYYESHDGSIIGGDRKHKETVINNISLKQAYNYICRELEKKIESYK